MNRSQTQPQTVSLGPGPGPRFRLTDGFSCAVEFHAGDSGELRLRVIEAWPLCPRRAACGGLQLHIWGDDPNGQSNEGWLNVFCGQGRLDHHRRQAEEAAPLLGRRPCNPLVAELQNPWSWRGSWRDLWLAALCTVDGWQDVLRFCREIPNWYLGRGPRPIGILPSTPDVVTTGVIERRVRRDFVVRVVFGDDERSI